MSLSEDEKITDLVERCSNEYSEIVLYEYMAKYATFKNPDPHVVNGKSIQRIIKRETIDSTTIAGASISLMITAEFNKLLYTDFTKYFANSSTLAERISANAAIHVRTLFYPNYIQNIKFLGVGIAFAKSKESKYQPSGIHVIETINKIGLPEDVNVLFINLAYFRNEDISSEMDDMLAFKAKIAKTLKSYLGQEIEIVDQPMNTDKRTKNSVHAFAKGKADLAVAYLAIYVKK